MPFIKTWKLQAMIDESVREKTDKLDKVLHEGHVAWRKIFETNVDAWKKTVDKRIDDSLQLLREHMAKEAEKTIQYASTVQDLLAAVLAVNGKKITKAIQPPTKR